MQTLQNMLFSEMGLLAPLLLARMKQKNRFTRIVPTNDAILSVKTVFNDHTYIRHKWACHRNHCFYGQLTEDMTYSRQLCQIKTTLWHN